MYQKINKLAFVVLIVENEDWIEEITKNMADLFSKICHTKEIYFTNYILSKPVYLRRTSGTTIPFSV